MTSSIAPHAGTPACSHAVRYPAQVNDLLPVEEVLAVLHGHGIELLVVFGSRARGTAAASSDLDVAVLREDGRRLTLLEIGGLAADLARLAGHDVDVVDLRAADTLVRFEIAKDGKVLHEGRPGAWTAVVAQTLIEHDEIAHWLPALIAGVGRAARKAGGAT